MENVGALTFRGLDAVLGSLSEIGYNAEWTNLSAKEVGAVHQRERIWIIAYPSEIRRERATGEIFDKTSFKKQFWSETSFNQLLLSEKTQYENISENVRMDDGIPYFMERFSGLGNAIVPQIAELLFNQIKPLLQGDIR